MNKVIITEDDLNRVENLQSISVEEAKTYFWLPGEINVKGDINKAGHCAWESCPTDITKGECCELKEDPERVVPDEHIIHAVDYDIKVKAKIYRHRNRSISLLKWARNLIIPQKKINNKPLITVRAVKNKKYSADKPEIKQQDHKHEEDLDGHEKIFSVGPRSNTWITKSLIIWILRKQVVDKVGKSM